MEYTAIPKGSGFVYEHRNHLYQRVRTAGSTKYLKCTVVGCDGSAKLVGDQFIVGVRQSFLANVNGFHVRYLLSCIRLSVVCRMSSVCLSVCNVRAP